MRIQSRIAGKSNVFLAGALCLVILLAQTSTAQLPVTSLSTLTPNGAKQGTEIEVTIGGGDQETLTQLVFSHPGITAVQKTNPQGEFDTAPIPVNNVFTVTINADVPPGIYDARVIGQYGVSNPRSFQVGTLEELRDPGNNHTIETATELAVNTTVTGVADAAKQDHYKVDLKLGQRIIADVVAQRIDSKLNATLVLYDAEGRELANNTDSIGRDALLDFTAPSDGSYYVALYDFVYAGGGELFYRLNVHDRPHIDFVSPAVLKAGVANKVTVYGRNLPGGKPAENAAVEGVGLQQLELDITAPAIDQVSSITNALRSGYVSGASFSHSGSNAVSYGVTDLNVIAETAAENNTGAQAMPITAPGVVSGNFYPAGDQDYYQLEAKSGEVYWVDVVSHRLGLDTDPKVIIEQITQDAEGNEVVKVLHTVDDPGDRNGRIGTDFDSSTDDPSVRFAVPADGTYRILVRDNFGGSRNDARAVYHLQLRPEQQDFRILVQTRQTKVANANEVKNFAAVLRKSDTLLLETRIDRFDGFAGEVTISVEGLPEGVTCKGAHVDTKQATALLIIEASPEAKSWAGPITIVGKGMIGEAEVSRSALTGTVVWPTANRTQTPAYFRAASQQWLAVVDIEDGAGLLQVGDGAPLETSRGGKIDVPLTFTRGVGLDDVDIKFVAQGLPNEVKPADVTIKKGEGNGTLAIAIANNNAKAGIYTFYLRADSKVKRARNPKLIADAEAKAVRITELKTATDAEVTAAQEAFDKAEGDEAKKAAEEKLNAAKEKQKRVDAAKAAADKAVEDAKKANAPKDVNVALKSTAVQLRVVQTAIGVTGGDVAVKAGEKVMIPVKVERLYGFAEAVELEVAVPGTAKGVTAAKLSVAKEAAEGMLEITTAADAAVGDHAVTLNAKAKFNNVDITATATVKVSVQAAAAE